MTDRIKWGIIGTGNIAHQFARGLQAAADVDLVAVASRSQERADEFGDEFDVPHRHATYQALADNSEVEAVYVATPHTSHKENTIMCLNGGKHVLCEKPFAVNYDEAQAMVDLAREKNLFLMDAIWTRYFPIMVKLRQLLAEDVIGDVMLVQADFGFRMGTVNPEHRLFNPALAGGALLDVGIYPVQFASMVYGKQPVEIATQVTIGETKVDELSVMVFKYDDYEMATLTTAIRLKTPHEARIMGTRGYISIPDWWHPTQMTIQADGESKTYSYDLEGNGYNYEIEEVGRCIRAGLTESEAMSLDETLAIIKTMDTIRQQWDLSYPMES